LEIRLVRRFAATGVFIVFIFVEGIKCSIRLRFCYFIIYFVWGFTHSWYTLSDYNVSLLLMSTSSWYTNGGMKIVLITVDYSSQESLLYHSPS